jgi:hypothetical protein
MAHRLSLALAALTALAPSVTTLAVAASPPTGTIACSVFSDLNTGQAKGIIYRPFINAVPRAVRFAATNVGSTCDNSAVSGGKAPITGVAIKLTARLSEGTCGTLTSAAPPFENARIALKWRGLNGANHYTTVATSRARIATVTYDVGTHAFDMTTEPLTGNAFVGKTLSFHLGIEEVADELEAGCGPVNGYVATPFGNTNPATLEVQ